jgi:phosphatidate cytidylyltransferase
MHLKRWLTGIVATPILIYVIGFGPRTLFHALVFLTALQGLIEFFRLASQELPRSLRWAIYGTTFLLFLCVSAGALYFLPFVVFLWAAVPMTYFMSTYRRAGHQSTEVVAKAAMGPLYIALPMTMLVIIDRFPRGKMWIFFLLVVVFACDTGAFYAGRTFGRHKLHPSVSPGKTWEGAVGGLAASLLAAFVWTRFSTIHPFDVRMFFLAAMLSVSGQIGDLAESMLKRNQGVKDSGTMLPGHGGVLDRIDAHLFAIPVLFAYLSL